jgi:hypothetical protein
MAVQIQFRRDTAANWTSENPTLAAGELGYETDTGNIKIGDGSTSWTSLGYNGVSSTYVTTQISNLVDSAPGALDTLNELAAALNDDANFATTVTDALALKQDKVTGVSDTEIGYLDGVTSAIQTQLDARVSEVNGAVTTAATDQTVVRNITLSTSDPSGGIDGDVWLKYTA